jgi:hypothetical protein
VSRCLKAQASLSEEGGVAAKKRRREWCVSNRGARLWRKSKEGKGKAKAAKKGEGKAAKYAWRNDETEKCSVYSVKMIEGDESEEEKAAAAASGIKAKALTILCAGLQLSIPRIFW